ncbi:MAG: hypothetical protein Q7S17_00770 [Xanthobacteraceae bacterium]|nr:hypothetical protein [Xanthobacteraceae bacterium]
MSAREMACRLSKPQRDHLIEHISGPQPIQTGPQTLIIGALISRKLIRCIHKFSNHHPKFPHHTEFTELGREVTCIILGSYADALVRAGVLEHAPPIALVRNAPMITPTLAGREADLAHVMTVD